MRNLTRRDALALAGVGTLAAAGCASQDTVGEEGSASPTAATVTVEPLDPEATADWDAAYYTPQYASVADAAEAARSMARRVEASGIVLLKNNGALPLTAGTRVSLLGRSGADLLYGGLGSGAVPADTPCSTLLEGLEAAGLDVNAAPAEWALANLAGYPRASIQTLDDRSVTTFYIGEIPWRDYPVDVRDSIAGTTAIVALGRASGEGFDLSRDLKATLADERYSSFVPNSETENYVDGQHSLELTAEELELVAAAKEACGKVVVLLATGTSMEVGPLVEEGGAYEADAILHIGFLGASGALAVGDVLTGAVNPSGRTCDLWARDLTLAPSFATMGEHRYTDVSGFYPGNESTGDGAYFCEYLEGVYVGYRYFETAADDGVLSYEDAVTFPFGYGLSYTEFACTLDDVAAENEQVTTTVSVTNTGEVAGRDVVELYVAPPWEPGGAERPSVQLVAFSKTDELAPGENVTLELSWPLRGMAAWDAPDACWRLDGGSYVVSLRANSHDVLAQVALELDEQTWSTDSATGNALAARFAECDAYLAANCTTLSRSDLADTFPTAESAADKTLAACGVTLAEYDAEAAADPDAVMPTTGADNGLSLIDLRGRAYDDPAWELLLDQLATKEMLANVCERAGAAVASVGMPESTWSDNPAGFENAVDGLAHCAWPCEYLVAQSWDAALLHEVGEAVGEEALASGYFGWWAPAINIHRSPFSGRNFEYYSEDPLLAGTLAAQVVDGCASRGVINVLKHFCVYDQESCRREHLLTWASEQAIREIYARPFEIVVKAAAERAVPVLDASTGERAEATVSAPLALMSSYNFLGSTWAGGLEALQSGLVRSEWGFAGVVISDFSVDDYYMDHDQGIAAGTDLMLATSATGTVANVRSATTVQNLRRSMHRLLYVVANSCAMNGIAPTALVR